ncbi:mechanosensitive ion channel domain-containing protein [Tundrisphaera lichenicola]|uniref:mechanosensitive ion channel family protein n=1 Tax=Tundrisphaera lichenicola TaxID=2029860 RepID=UPI003EBE5938
MAQRPTNLQNSKPAVSVAEQVNHLSKAIEAGEERIKELKADRENPASEYFQSQTAFEEADEALESQKKALKALAEEDQVGREAAQAEVVRLEKARNQAKERFDLAIEDRKISAEQLVNVEQKLQRDRKALDKLEGKAEPEVAPAIAPVEGKAGTETAAQPAGPPSTSAGPVVVPPGSASLPSGPASVPAHVATVSTPAPSTSPAPTPAQAVEAALPSPDKGRAPSKELIEAQQDAQTKAEVSKEAEADAQSVTDRLASLDREIALEQQLLTTGRKQRDNATEIRRDLTESFRARSLAGAPRAELDVLLDQVKQLEKRLKAASDDVQEHSIRLEELQTERAGLQAEQLDALRKVEEARAQVKVAEADIKRLENPFSPHNILQWSIDHGPRILTILLAMLAAHWLSKLFSQRVIRLLAHNGARGSSIEREARARTLVGVCHNAASMAIYVGGGLMILQEAGIPIAPLLGGAAVFGLAVAFGAQNLIRDYFYGFVILLENQYKLNDVVQIGDLSGQVEKITLRMTVLRDLEGRAHFLPNGAITAVTNMTHGWSRALFDIGVAYKENVDRVMAVLMTLSNELRADPVYAPMILEDATMLGVDQFGDSAVVIKFFIKTRPLQQWNVKRELLRRIKNRFDELEIEIPFPHRTVYHRVESGANLPESLGNPSRILHGSHARG